MAMFRSSLFSFGEERVRNSTRGTGPCLRPERASGQATPRLGSSNWSLESSTSPAHAPPGTVRPSHPKSAKRWLTPRGPIPRNCGNTESHQFPVPVAEQGIAAHAATPVLRRCAGPARLEFGTVSGDGQAPVDGVRLRQTPTPEVVDVRHGQSVHGAIFPQLLRCRRPRFRIAGHQPKVGLHRTHPVVYVSSRLQD